MEILSRQIDGQTYYFSKLSSKNIFGQTRHTINSYSIYDTAEAQNITFLLLEHFFNLSKTEVLADKIFEVSESTFQEFSESLERLLQNEPLQYILGHTFFYGKKFLVNPDVLIPRPETEELVLLILEEHKITKNKLKILDIGTGSGCIAITLAQNLENTEVLALDISEDALKIAQQNAQNLEANVQFIQNDFLHSPPNLKNLDIIVSNPPYVTQKEQNLMRKNVLAYEPHVALFVENDNPFIFYEKITAFAQKTLNPKGKLYFEINEKYGKEITNILAKNNFQHINTKEDMFGKPRFVHGIK